MPESELPSRRRHRGPAPEDVLFDDPARTARLRKATQDLSWLLRWGYAQKAATELVGNRYQLSARERLALSHAAWGREGRSVPVKAEELAGQRLCIDGFNLLITLESALGGGILIRGVDGLLRDIANIHGNYTLRLETERAVELSAEALKELETGETLWLFDRPVSNSGRIAALVNQVAADRGIVMHAETADRVDSRLKECDGIVVTADSAILDSGVRWFDLAGWIISRKIPEAKIVDLG